MKTSEIVSIDSIKKVIRMISGGNANIYGQGLPVDTQTYNIIGEHQLDAEKLVSIVANGSFGFATEVAKTVAKYRRCSEKQAYVIARVLFENADSIEALAGMESIVDIELEVMAKIEEDETEEEETKAEAEAAQENVDKVEYFKNLAKAYTSDAAKVRSVKNDKSGVKAARVAAAKEMMLDGGYIVATYAEMLDRFGKVSGLKKTDAKNEGEYIWAVIKEDKSIFFSAVYKI